MKIVKEKNVLFNFNQKLSLQINILVSMNKLAKNGSAVFLVITWILTCVFFVDSANILDIVAGNDYVINHPDDDVYGTPDEDYYSIADLLTNHNYQSDVKYQDFHLHLIKKVLVDQDSYSTESIKPFNEQILIDFQKFNCSLYSYKNTEKSLFLKNCALLI